MSAIFSPCGTWRYRLERELDAQLLAPPLVAAIFGVNPSTADAIVNDQTIRKDIGFACRLGWSKIIKGNKFAYRATDVRELAKAADPVGPENNEHLEAIIADADILVAAWGPLAKLPSHLRNRWRRIAALAEAYGKPLHCFGTAKDGHPRHTLMLPYDTPLVRWTPPA